MEACRAMQKGFLWVLALDRLCRHQGRKNLQPVDDYAKDILNVLDGEIGSEPTKNEYSLMKKIGNISILLAGPPYIPK